MGSEAPACQRIDTCVRVRRPGEEQGPFVRLKVGKRRSGRHIDIDRPRRVRARPPLTLPGASRDGLESSLYLPLPLERLPGQRPSSRVGGRARLSVFAGGPTRNICIPLAFD